jgi:TonB family protein
MSRGVLLPRRAAQARSVRQPMKASSTLTISRWRFIALGGVLQIALACSARQDPTPNVRQCVASAAPLDSVVHDSTSVTQKPAPRQWVPLMYPEGLRQKGIQGVVWLRLRLATTGMVDSATVVSAADPGFVAPALYAVQHTTFWPACVGSHPVPYEMLLPVNFVLRHVTYFLHY